MITINLALFITICVFAAFGAFVFLGMVVYILIALIDLTYWNRHKEDAIKCPDFIEKEGKENE